MGRVKLQLRPPLSCMLSEQKSSDEWWTREHGVVQRPSGSALRQSQMQAPWLVGACTPQRLPKQLLIESIYYTLIANRWAECAWGFVIFRKDRGTVWGD